MIALVMAGGKGTRMGKFKEKPLIKINNKTMVEHVLEALRETKELSKIVVTVSRYTPKTKKFLSKLKVEIMDTPGKGYIEDMKFAIKKLRKYSRYFLVVSADLPLINKQVIDKVLKHYKRSKKPALTVMALAKAYKQLGIETDYKIVKKEKILVPVGINVIDGYRIDEEILDEEVLILKEVNRLINVNTLKDLKLVKKILSLKT